MQSRKKWHIWGVGKGVSFFKLCIWGKASKISTNKNIILHPVKITSVLLPPFAWHAISIIQIHIKMSTEISGNCGEGKYAGAESPFVLQAQQTGWRDRKSVNNISKKKKKLLDLPDKNAMVEGLLFARFPSKMLHYYFYLLHIPLRVKSS